MQALFEAVVASLGRVQLLKLEDSGDVFLIGPDVKPPDFRIVTAEGDQMLVEVKNFYPNRATASFRMRAADLEEMRLYARLVGVKELKVAIYWSRWNYGRSQTRIASSRMAPTTWHSHCRQRCSSMRWGASGTAPLEPSGRSGSLSTRIHRSLGR